MDSSLEILTLGLIQFRSSGGTMPDKAPGDVRDTDADNLERIVEVEHGRDWLARVLVRLAFTSSEERDEIARLKACVAGLEKRCARQVTLIKANPTAVLAGLQRCCEEPMTCGHSVECWDEKREECVWCALQELRKPRLVGGG